MLSLGMITIVVDDYDEAIGFTELPRSEAFGQVVVFKDNYGNKWDLIERK